MKMPGASAVLRVWNEQMVARNILEMEMEQVNRRKIRNLLL